MENFEDYNKEENGKEENDNKENVKEENSNKENGNEENGNEENKNKENSNKENDNQENGNEENKNKLQKNKIKHLVLSGGGPIGYIELGILKFLEENDFWNINDIESIYATSVGTILATLISMKFEWNMITDYLIKRPWQEAVKITPSMFFDAYSKKGLLDRKAFEIVFRPFFVIKDWSIDITMKEFYEATNIELHFFTLEANLLEIFDINYKSFPDLPILTAMQMSSALPGVICPVCIEGNFYIDGGIMCNYPLKKCIENVEDKDTIFGIYNFYKKNNNILKEDSTILEYMVNIITNMTFSLGEKYIPEENSIKNELIIKSLNLIKFEDLKTILYEQTKREELYEQGIDYAIKFLDLYQ